MHRNIKRIIVPTALVIFLISIIAACGSDEAKESTTAKKLYNTGLSADEINNEAFADIFPLQYESYKRNEEMSDTKYGGSVPTSKFDHTKEPYLPIIFNGYGFAKEYNEDRGHIYAIEDNVNIARITDKSIGSCLTCKSTAVPILLEEDEFGDGYWSANFRNEIVPRAEELGHSPIGCSDCHDPETMELRVTRPMFATAMEARGVDISNPTKNEMRTYVCAQCHVEYYFEPEKKAVTFPWTNGLKPEEMYEYYDTIAKDSGFAQDWIHTVSGAPMLKAQHPEFEIWSEGPHGIAEVSCSDCHMPYERSDGKKKITSHQWTSPLKTVEQSCRTCHADKTEQELIDRVEGIQDAHMENLHKAEEISIDAHYYINKMITTGAPESKIEEAQQLVRKGQWLFDIVAAENSAGFHDPQGAMDSMKKSTEALNEAIIIATEELVKLDVNIDELKEEIAKVKKAVYDEPDVFKKKDHVINDYFPNQQPPKN
ncbi:ammonia-forming cytochrome c nitrite reductase subunit c552 [Cytobacillus sp. IB215316]|uniref:ammonia-forming cytochrome c nitrite reductase subunit c552 n=1 Tax=Cytobacillus sp. IB215316 TaxID=3097354 RepID=UPI002A17AA25|nr:ammonia-forming cytochrome c nitrite reductase subunit c552 [Cytobacillus sp. IB215316]MDX8359492.1 ammonia-forming cytochrome c nitrite reductase subunit c552 [Cytobacillus sp. IB215316]